MQTVNKNSVVSISGGLTPALICSFLAAESGWLLSEAVPPPRGRGRSPPSTRVPRGRSWERADRIVMRLLWLPPRPLHRYDCSSFQPSAEPPAPLWSGRAVVGHSAEACP